MPKPGPGKHDRDAGGNLKLPEPQPVTYRTNGRFNTAWVNEKADEWAKSLARVTESQIRRFYEYVVRLKRRLDVEAGLDVEKRKQVFEALRPEFLMLKARAIYAHGRSKSQFPEEALKFFVNHTASVKTVEDFEDFCRHFEAVMAFHKAYCQRQQQ